MDNKKVDQVTNQTLERINFWIGNADSKISFILSFAGIFLGFIFASDSINESIKDLLKILGDNKSSARGFFLALVTLLSFIGSMTFIGISLYYLLGALKGRINLENNHHGFEDNSILFWGSISKFGNYTTYKQRLDSVQEDELFNDLASQVYINSLTCTKKFQLYNKGIDKLVWGIILFVVFKILTYLM